MDASKLNLEFLQLDDNKIPIPDPEFLRKNIPKTIVATAKDKRGNPKELPKHERAYDAYCHWMALPENERKPVTATAFEKKWSVPDRYTAEFRQREDFQDRRLRYFWEWMMDKLPNVVEAIYKGAVRGNSAQAKIFAELIAKHINIDKPPQTIQPLMLVGVPQDKIDQLFVPRGYEKAQDIIPIQ